VDKELLGQKLAASSVSAKKSKEFMTYLFLVMNRHSILEGEREGMMLFQVTSWGQWMVVGFTLFFLLFFFLKKLKLSHFLFFQTQIFFKARLGHFEITKIVEVINDKGMQAHLKRKRDRKADQTQTKRAKVSTDSNNGGAKPRVMTTEEPLKRKLALMMVKQRTPIE
jgi:hypothetical protein